MMDFLTVLSRSYGLAYEVYKERAKKTFLLLLLLYWIISVELPSWINSITPNGIKTLTKGKAIIRPGDIEVCQLVAVVPEGTSKQRHQQEYENARADETRKFD